MDAESGDDDKNGLTSEWGGESRTIGPNDDVGLMTVMTMWSDRNRRKQKQWTAWDEAELRRRQTSLTSDDERRRLRRVESDYSRERLHDSWTRNLMRMFDKAGAPKSQWWTQYMIMATVRINCSLHVYHHRQ